MEFPVATFLSRLGRFAFKHRLSMVLAWLAILGGSIFAGLTAPSPPADDFSMPGTESQQTFELMEERFPGMTAEAGGATVVFVAPDGEDVTAPRYQAAISAAVDELAGGDQVVNVDDPFESDAVSDDGSAAYTSVTYSVPASEVTDDSRTAIDSVIDTARDS